MSTRRGFLKCLVGLGAGILPWWGWPDLFKNFTPQAAQAFIKESSLAKSSADAAQMNNSYLNGTAMEDILTFTQPDFQGRRAGTVGEDKASAYLLDQMEGLGLEPLGDVIVHQKRNYLNIFTIYPVKEEFYQGRLTFRPGNPADLRTPSANLIGGLLGTDSSESVILSAHYDHLGIYQGELYPGANDNASGVGCILDVMRRLKKEGIKPKRNIVLAFWSAEEMGFVGSDSFLHSPTLPLKSIKAVFNVDTVGNGALEEFALWADSNNQAVQTIQAAAAEYNARAVLAPKMGHNSDQLYFNLNHVPAVTLMASDWLVKNHTPEDVPDFVNPQKIALASNILYKAVQKLAF